MQRDYPISTTLLQTAILDTVRVFDEYCLDANVYKNYTYRIREPKKHIYYLYKVYETVTGSLLDITAQNAKGNITEYAAMELENIFLEKLDKIVNKEIVLSPEQVKKDVYKSAGGVLGVVQLIIIILIGFIIFVGFKGCRI